LIPSTIPLAFKEDSSKYDYATREEAENISRLLNSLAKEIEKMRGELAEVKHTAGKKGKKK
jgi:hypothetical protein